MDLKDSQLILTFKKTPVLQLSDLMQAKMKLAAIRPLFYEAENPIHIRYYMDAIHDLEADVIRLTNASETRR